MNKMNTQYLTFWIYLNSRFLFFFFYLFLSFCLNAFSDCVQNMQLSLYQWFKSCHVTKISITYMTWDHFPLEHFLFLHWDQDIPTHQTYQGSPEHDHRHAKLEYNQFYCRTSNQVVCTIHHLSLKRDVFIVSPRNQKCLNLSTPTYFCKISI